MGLFLVGRYVNVHALMAIANSNLWFLFNEICFYNPNQDSLESPEEGRLPDAKKGTHMHFACLCTKMNTMIVLLLLNVMLWLSNFAAGAPHLKDIFYRMGLFDKDIVALSGAHTLV